MHKTLENYTLNLHRGQNYLLILHAVCLSVMGVLLVEDDRRFGVPTASSKSAIAKHIVKEHNT